MDQELLKKKIQRSLNQATEEFMAREDIVTTFGKPQIAYVDAKDVIFDMLFTRGFCDHPKKIYRPGNTIITYYIPVSIEVTAANERAEGVADEWRRAQIESLWLAMILNRKINEQLDLVGRLHSHLNTMLEWDKETCRGEWNHNIMAALGGLGHIGPNGSFIARKVEEGFSPYGGRTGGIITDGLFASKAEHRSGQELDAEYEKLMAVYSAVSPEMARACPAGAIGKDGIDRKACQEYCIRYNEKTPSPEACGKCFGF